MRYPTPVEARLGNRAGPIYISFVYRPHAVDVTGSNPIRLKAGWAPCHERLLTPAAVVQMRSTGVTQCRLVRPHGLDHRSHVFDTADLLAWPADDDPQPLLQHIEAIERTTRRIPSGGRMAYYRFVCSCGYQTAWTASADDAADDGADHHEAVRCD